MTLTVDEALRKGVTAHQAGEIQEADRYYTAVLNVQPRNPDANHNMGILAVGVGKAEQALTFFKTALEVNPNIDQFWISYISTLLDLGRFDDARVSLELVRNNGAQGDAFDQFEQRLNQSRSDNVPVALEDPSRENLQGLLNILRQGKCQEMLELSAQLLERFPRSLMIYNLRGAAYGELKQFSQAIDSFEHVLNIAPNNADAYSNMGNALREKGDFELAADKLRRAIEIRPDFVDAYYNLGLNYEALGDLDNALKNYQQALKLDPTHMKAYNNLGNMFLYAGNIDAAIENYNQALSFWPDFAEAHNNLGNAYEETNDLPSALACYQRALELNPEYASAHNNYGSVLADKNDVKEAIKSYERALRFKPNYPEAQAQKLHLHAQLCSWDDLRLADQEISGLGTAVKEIAPFSVLCLEDSPTRHRLRAEFYAKKKFRFEALPFDSRSIKEKSRLRIGYFSADFQDHPVTHLIIRTLELHNRDDFEVYAYSFGRDNGGDARERLTKAVDVFKEVSALNVIDINLLAREDALDIAIDLTSYTKDSRTGIFAYRAAPIQINYLGFPGTMGADFMDYIIVDDVLVPDVLREHYSENVIRLPDAYMATDNTRVISSSVMSRSEMGLPKDGFVFCVFNNSYKITPMVFDIWMRLLCQVEGSVLWLRRFHKTAEENLCREAEARGVDSSRLIFAERVPMSEHLARHRLADLFLDTFIFNAHSTAIDALWAGLPVVTKLGESFTARVAGSLLTSVGMSELVTSTEEDYEALALDLATNSDRLESVKRQLSEHLLSMPLFDSEQFTKHLESGYRQAYQRHIDGQGPADIRVSSLCARDL